MEEKVVKFLTTSAQLVKKNLQKIKTRQDEINLFKGMCIYLFKGTRWYVFNIIKNNMQNKNLSH